MKYGTVLILLVAAALIGQAPIGEAVVVHHANFLPKKDDLKSAGSRLYRETTVVSKVNVTQPGSNTTRITGIVELVTGEFKHEIMLDETLAPAPVVNKWLLMIVVMFGGGFCGIDRCLMGQVLLGVLKGVTCGGCYCWFLVDSVILVVNALMHWKSVRAIWMYADFHPDTCTPAFWVCLGLMAWNVFAVLFAPKNTAKASLRRRGILNGMPSKSEIDAAFKTLDKDKSGKISRQELVEGVEILGLRNSEEEIDEFMKAADKDEDGSIDYDEFFEITSKPGLRS